MSHAVVLYHCLKGLFAYHFSNFMKNEYTISPELLEFMQQHKIQTSVDLLAIENETLLSMKGFGWRLMREVLILREA